jgi:RloB-like protein
MLKFSHYSMKRTSKSKGKIYTINKRILIICEGETESEYFNAFKTDESLKSSLAGVSIDAYQPTDFSPLGLVNEAKRKKKDAERQKNPFDSIWVVFDKDGHAKIPEAFQAAKDAKIKRAFSSVCFEFWVVLHFEFTSKVFNDSDDLVSYIKKKHYSEYKKGSECFTHLRQKVEVAIANAQRICKSADADIDAGYMKLCEYNPYTNVHELVLELLSLKKEEQKTKDDLALILTANSPESPPSDAPQT